MDLKNTIIFFAIVFRALYFYMNRHHYQVINVNNHEFVLRISKYLDHNPCIVYVPARMNRDDRLEEYSGLDFCNE